MWQNKTKQNKTFIQNLCHSPTVITNICDGIYLFVLFTKKKKKYPSVNGTKLLSFSISDHIYTVSHNTLRTATQIKRLKYAQVPETKIRNEDSNCTQSNSTYDKSMK